VNEDRLLTAAEVAEVPAVASRAARDAPAEAGMNSAGHQGSGGSLPRGSRGLLSVRKVAELAGFSEMAIYRAISAGELRASKLRGQLRIRPEDFDKWVDENVVDAARGYEPSRVPVAAAVNQARPGRGLRELLRQ
jgi:excisionase family DNA binding protein